MFRDCEGFHRRDFLKIGATGLVGMTLPEMLRSEAHAANAARQAQAKSVIMVWLAGGPSTIDMWDLKPEAPENIRGEFKAIKTDVPAAPVVAAALPDTASPSP